MQMRPDFAITIFTRSPPFLFPFLCLFSDSLAPSLGHSLRSARPLRDEMINTMTGNMFGFSVTRFNNSKKEIFAADIRLSDEITDDK